jgi:hypothetical protein
VFQEEHAEIFIAALIKAIDDLLDLPAASG